MPLHFRNGSAASDRMKLHHKMRHNLYNYNLSVKIRVTLWKDVQGYLHEQILLDLLPFLLLQTSIEQSPPEVPLHGGTSCRH